ncbi:MULTISPECIES: YihY/virulence factor BrkB family protein [Streptomyces]|uniref:YihY/virulence factor BrkB family protein n=2 Tax=Streptomyces rimosus subsp. rimosus TaxID=132474 RepID=L8EFW1_STRR1|nr:MULTISPECIES: YihY/virulence factor BrkB family protein [Streptomyces]KOG76856.1 membrane protein [Kitasatospora aureofaciens]MYT48506.1 YihY/virulence factor BrkB family protein [Streptomyces sp. SID5471]KEF07336.1 membrane protein [Streptomyces rimosus]KEF19663.1 membrane protein [Streptomyces rimosus]KOT33786.1 membrane protein [Streptomyces rimosus subsp. rimosus]
MDWLSKLPVIGPMVSWLMTTHLWRAYERMGQVHWTRLAAAITFTSFVALFPLLTVAAAIGAALLSERQLHDLQKKIAEQIPGISGQLDLGALVENAATVGVIAAVALLFTGAGWVDSIRDCLRAVWEKEDEDTNVFVAKLKDVALLLGLGGTALVSLACSGFATAAVGKAAEALGLAEGGIGSVLLSVAGFCIAVLADFLLFAYVLTKLPGVHPPRRAVVTAGFIGAIGFELLKLLLSGYLKGVAAKSMYGAFGTPIALLLWINFTAKLVVFCAAWTATQRCGPEAEGKALDCDAGEEDDGERPEVKTAAGGGTGGTGRPPEGSGATAS